MGEAMKKMRRFAVLLVVLVVGWACDRKPADACGPFMETAVFSGEMNPDAPLERYIGGRLGIFQPGYAYSYLFVAYRNMMGPGFADEDGRAILRLINNRISAGYDFGEFVSTSETRPAVKDWMDARALVAGKGKIPDVMKRIDYSSFQNCLDDSFRTAARVLREKIERLGGSAPEVTRWVAAQDQVFSNCSGGESIPQGLPADAPASAVYDRAYQVAAAHFYAGHYEKAAELFHGIAGDAESPWRAIAPYLEGRSLLRLALPGEVKEVYESPSNEEAKGEAKKRFAAAEKQFRQVLGREDLAELHPAAGKLINLIQFRLSPDERRKELAALLLNGGSGEEIEQYLTDYIWLLDKFAIDHEGIGRHTGDRGEGEGSHVEAEKGRATDDFDAALGKEDDLTDWIFTFQSDDKKSLDHALKAYQAKRSIPWLVAVVSKITPDDAGYPGILDDAGKIPKDSPAYLVAGFHMARCLALAGKSDEARSKVDELLSFPREQVSSSSVNLLLASRMSLSRSMDEFLHASQRIPVRIFVVNDYPFARLPASPAGGSDRRSARLSELSGGKTLFDADAAVVFNEMLPLRLWMQAIESPVLPDPLRLTLARAAWTRSILLDREDTALAVAAFLKERDTVLGPVLSAYTDAQTREARKFAAVFILLKHPGLHPYVSGGLGRLEPVDNLDNYRDNWWCALKCSRLSGENCKSETSDYYVDGTAMNDPMKVLYPGNKMVSPAFISAADRKEAENERVALASLGPASNYLTGYVVTCARGKSSFTDLAEALHLSVKSTRYGCPDDATTKYSKEAFGILHKKYPKSPWAKKTPYWF